MRKAPKQGFNFTSDLNLQRIWSVAFAKGSSYIDTQWNCITVHLKCNLPCSESFWQTRCISSVYL